MTINIISPEQYKTIPWKNGLGETTELAINEGGNVTNFDWRLSIARVTDDGFFSDFSNYSRNLILISGKGIRLEHDNQKIEQLDQLLDMASFDGGCTTFGTLISGEIKDFNIITKTSIYHTQVERYINQQSIVLKQNTQYFVYSISHEAKLNFNNETMELPCGYLLAISKINKEEVILKGRNLIVIQLLNL
jgi:environmental stress-induced protein Ves